MTSVTLTGFVRLYTMTDTVCMPDYHQFVSASAYYGTRAHEYVHATGHDSRLDRDNMNAFGTVEYAREELVAEIGSAMVCERLGIGEDRRIDNLRYVDAWIRIITDRPKALFQAIGAAQKACDWLFEQAGIVTDDSTDED